MAPEGSASSSSTGLTLCLQCHLPSSLLCCTCLHCTLNSPHANSLAKLPLFSQTLPTPFSSEFIRNCTFKISFLRIQKLIPFISYILWIKLNCEPVKGFPKVTKGPHRFAEEFNNIIIQIYQACFSASSYACP